VILGHDDALVIDAGGDLDKDAAGFARGADTGEWVVVHGHLYGWEFSGAFYAGFHVGGDTDVDVLSRGWMRVEGDRQEESSGKQRVRRRAMHRGTG